MSLVFATGAPALCGLLAKAFETERLAAEATVRAESGQPVPGLAAILAAKRAAADAFAGAVNAADGAKPPRSTHALLIGVGSYPHLAGGTLFAKQPAAMALGLGQLTSSVASAQAMADWLLTSFDNPERPLASIELLLSPGEYTPSEAAAVRLGAARGSHIPVQRATLENIRGAFDRWLQRCSSDRVADAFGDAIGDAALFFFSGHGLEKEVALLLPEDFGADPNVPFARAIDLTTTHRLMGQCKADMQCWFVDACREEPIELLISREKPGVTLKGDSAEPLLLRDAPIYKGAAEGMLAFGPRSPAGAGGAPSFFTTALIKCFNGLGAAGRVGPKWRLTSQSLRAGLNVAIDRVPPVNGRRVTCDNGSGTSNFTRVLHFAPHPAPSVVRVFCQPLHAQSTADLYLLNEAGLRIPRAARDARPWVTEVDAGQYTPGADFDPGGRKPKIGEKVILMPPDNDLPLPLD